MHVAALRKELDDPLFTRTGAGLAFTPGGLRLASKDLAAGRLVHVTGPGLDRAGEWCVATLAPSARQPAVSELVGFISTPRCIQAMIPGSGVGVTRFRPKVHVTLWS